MVTVDTRADYTENRTPIREMGRGGESDVESVHMAGSRIASDLSREIDCAHDKPDRQQRQGVRGLVPSRADQAGLRPEQGWGGRAKFASAAGVSASTVGRLLRGEMTADVRILGQVATALGYPVGDVLVRAGVLSADELQAARTPDRERPMTPEEAAAELGIVDPIDRDAFAAMVIAMQQRNQDRQ